MIRELTINKRDTTFTTNQQHNDDQVETEREHGRVGQYEGDGGQLVAPDNHASVDVEDQAAQPRPPATNRPKRNRKPNVKYNADVYDLSLILACKVVSGVQLSGVTLRKAKINRF